MSTFVLMYFFVLFVLCTFFVQKWLQAVKIYLHAKFRVSSSKIERVMLNLVFCSTDPSRPCDQPTCRAVRFAPTKNKIHANHSIMYSPILRFYRLPLVDLSSFRNTILYTPYAISSDVIHGMDAVSSSIILMSDTWFPSHENSASLASSPPVMMRLATTLTCHTLLSP